MRLLKFFAAVVYVLPVLAQSPQLSNSIPLTAQNILEVQNVITKPVTYLNRTALEVRDAAPQSGDDTPRMVLIKNVVLRNGTIDIDLSGDTAVDAPANLRGFVGIAFRIGDDRNHYECMYLRPKNGHSPDPVQRTHATQYIAQPDFPWNKLRADTPGKYESSAAIRPGEWIHVHMEILGRHAALFINDAKQPNLEVNDLKGAIGEGPIALWVGPGTIANFADLKITTRN